MVLGYWSKTLPLTIWNSNEKNNLYLRKLNFSKIEINSNYNVIMIKFITQNKNDEELHVWIRRQKIDCKYYSHRQWQFNKFVSKIFLKGQRASWLKSNDDLQNRYILFNVQDLSGRVESHKDNELVCLH